MEAEGTERHFLSFLLFKHLLPSPPEDVHVFALHGAQPPEKKGPEHQQCAGQSSLGGLRRTCRVGRLQLLVPEHIPAEVQTPAWGWRQGCPSASPGPGDPRARQTGMDLDVRDGGVAVPVVDLDVALAPEVSLKDVTVAVVPPPGAELPVPGAVQHVEELGVLHADHGEEVLVPQVAAEAVLVGQLPHLPRLQQAAVQGGLAHGLQVQQHHPAVEAGEPLGGRAPNPGLGVLVAELPERVPGRGKESRFNLVCVGETGCRP